MTTYLFVGDTHGDFEFVTRAIEHARRCSAEMIQLGDWGYIWPGSTKLKELSAMLVAQGVTMRFVDGNHDDHPKLRKLVSACAPTTIAPRLIYQPRGSVHEDEEGTRFLFCGGAPSIDRAFRTKGRSWWPEEIITDTEIERTLSAPSPIHVLVTHDAPDFRPVSPPRGRPATGCNRKRR